MCVSPPNTLSRKKNPVKTFKLIASACGFALLLGAGAASADVVVDTSGNPIVVDYPGGSNTNQHNLVGSDTLNEVMDCLTAGIGSACPGKITSASGITNYVGQGSGQGQRQMEGSPKPGTDELPCTVGGVSDPNGLPEQNPGCQEIAPMSGEMDKGVCDDDFTSATQQGTNASAESLAICADGIVVITDNTSLAQYGTSAAACAAETGSSPNTLPYQPNANYQNSGGLRHGGTLPADPMVPGSTAYTVTDWKDVLRLIYAGCENTDGTCDNKDHYTRCTDPVRRSLINHWSYLVDSGTLAGDVSTACHAQTCADSTNGIDGGLRAAYRRDDSSGTSGFFLSTLGLNKTTTHRTDFVTAGGKFTVIPTSAATPGDMFCDGGDVEGFVTESVACQKNTANACPDYTAPWSASGFPKTVTCPASGMCAPPPAIGETAPDEVQTCTPGSAKACRDFLNDNPTLHTLTCPASGVCPLPPAKGDPITKACDPNDVLCDMNGRTGVVRALVTPSTIGGVAPFPTLQCTTGNFAYVPFINVSIDVCPDGTTASSGQCQLPYFQILQNPSKPFNATTNPEIGRDFNCVTVASNHNSQHTTHMDARAFNAIVRDSNGVVQCLTGSGLTCTLPAIAQWRQRMATLSQTSVKGGTIGTVSGTTVGCQQPDATRLMGCVVGSTQCTIGFAGREVAEDAGSQALQEPFRINESYGTDANVLGSLADKGLATPNAADYVFARYLYLGAIGGFHNVTGDCQARGGSAAYCADELAIVREFTTNYNVATTGGAAVCAGTGFIALPATNSTTDNAGNPVDLHSCRSALDSGATANTCGAPGAARTAFPKDGSILPNEPSPFTPCQVQ